MTGRTNGMHARQEFWFSVKGPDVLPRGNRGLNALGEAFARRSEIERLDPGTCPPLQFRGGNNDLGVGKDLRVSLMVHEAVNVVAMKMGEQDRLDGLGIEPSLYHALQQLSVPLAIDRVSAGTRIDQRHLIAHLDGPGGEHERRMGVWKSGGAQRGLDLLDSDVFDHPLPQWNVMHPVEQREDFNVADLVPAEGSDGGLLSVSRTDKRDRFVDPKCSVSTSCTKHQIAA